MQLSATGARAEALARLLVERLRGEYPTLYQDVWTSGAIAAVDAEPSMALRMLERPTEGMGCSVAGTCDVGARRITVVEAGRGRMQYTVLHELGHLLMAECDDYQDAFVESTRSVANRSRVTEDICEALAALLLFPSDEAILGVDAIGLNARGFQQLTQRVRASREACAVWIAQRLRSPGYALICTSDGVLQFAARSGDAIPLARDTSQSETVLGPLFAGASNARARGRFRLRSGAFGEELYVDAVRDGRLIYAVAVTDSPDWPVLHQPVDRLVVEPVEGWCDRCGESFRSYRTCSECGFPVHNGCGRCECQPIDRGHRICTSCYLELHVNLFDGASAVCRDCAH